ncbi:hypothetical protein DRQ53_04115 [bacterium]|nr:MAG: hypothetical protein DRQ32_02515 [bacterium]RKZ17236.1 MAG: hypothetical protein DRQ53_04115 [bacterium]
MLHFLLLLLAIQIPTESPSSRTIEYEELWRTDPYSDEYLMGNVMAATTDDEGNSYLLDAQLQEVFKFDADGNYVDTVARKGEGPGELDQTWSIAYWSPGAIILPRVFPPQVIRIALDGTPLEELHVYRDPADDAKASVSTITPVGDFAVVMGSMFQFGSDGSKMVMWLGVIDRNGSVVHEFGDMERELPSDPLKQVVDEQAEFWEWNRWAASDAGHVFRAPDREKWLIERYDLDGNLTGTFSRDIKARERTEAEFEDMKGGRTFVFNGQKADISYKLLDTEAPLRGLVILNGQLWVIHNQAEGELPDGVWRRASVLSFDGELIEDVDLKVPHDPELDTVQLLDDGRVMVVENGVAAQRSQFAAFTDDSDNPDDEDLSDAEPAEVVIYAPRP